MASARPTLPESGELAAHPVPALLLELWRARFSGRLTLQRQRTDKQFEFDKGSPVQSESNLASDALAPQLVDRGDIRREDQARIEQIVAERKCAEGAAVLALKLLDPKTLVVAMRDQLRRRLTDCFVWPDGSFRLEPGPELDGVAQPLKINPHHVVQTGLAAHWSPERMLEGLTPRLEQFPTVAAKSETVFRRMDLDAVTQQILAAFNGTRTLGAALAPAFTSPSALAAIWVADVSGLLRYSDVPAGREEEEADLEIEISISGREPSAAASSAGPRQAAAAQAGGLDSGKQESLRADILGKRERLSDLNYYELLGVAEDAKAVLIKKAYFKLAKTYHPDALSRLGLTDISQEANEVFARIAEAFDVLSKNDKRREYDASLSMGGGDIDVERLAQAEAAFRKGEILLNMGNFRGALEFLKPAAELWPDEPEYQSAYGWALFKKTPPEVEASLEHLTLALDLNPENALALFRRGMVLRHLGEEAEAADHLARGKALDPSVG